jgi:hypothetical protein
VSTLESSLSNGLDDLHESCLPSENKAVETLPALNKDAPLPKEWEDNQFKQGWPITVPLPDHPSPKVVARYIYPCDRQSAITPASLLPGLRFVSPAATTARSLYNTLARACMRFNSFFIDDQPGVIEYSAAQIASKLEICVEMQAIEFTCPRIHLASESGSDSFSPPDKVLGVVAFLRSEDGNSLGPTRKIPIVAKSRRVRQLLNDRGFRAMTEDIYRDEIKVALRGLRAKLDARK